MLGGCVGWFLDPGLGKTLATTRYVCPPRRVPYFPALIVCRRDDYLTWELELKREGYVDSDMFFIEHKDEVTVRKVSGKDEYQYVMQQKFPNKPKLWNFITYDLPKGDMPKDRHGKKQTRGHIKMNITDAGQWVLDNNFEFCAADEVHSIKCWQSYRTKIIIFITRHIPRRIGLTGTAVTNSYEDGFSIMYFIDNGRTFGRDYYKFMQKFFIKVKGAGWYPNRKKMDLLKRRFASGSYSAKSNIKVEEKPVIIKGVPMRGKQRRLYEQVLTDWELELDDGAVLEYKYVMSKMHKLKQIASGFYYYYDPKDLEKQRKDPTFRPSRKVKRLANNKIKLLEDLFKDPEYFKNRKKIVIWTSYGEEIEMISEMLHRRHIKHIKFNMSNPNKKKEARLAFRDDPSIQVFLCNAERGVGMDELKVAYTAAYFSNSHKVVAKIQSKKRTKRKGSEIHDHVEYWELMTEGTVDIPVYYALMGKINIADYIISECSKGAKLRNLLAY